MLETSAIRRTTAISGVLLLLFVAISAVPAVSGTGRTGGAFEILADTVSKAGTAPMSGGGMVLYHTAGQQAGNAISSGGDYSLTGGFLGAVDETPPSMSFTSPDALSSNSGNVAVAGSVFDENNSSWTLSYGPGASPSLWKQINSGSANTVNASLATWDASKLWGTYTLKITATDSRGNTGSATRTVTVWNSETFSATIPADKWSMVSLPGIPQNPDPHSYLGSSRYEVQRWDPSMQPNEDGQRYMINFAITAGDGFWIKPYRTPISYSMQAWVPDTTSDFQKQLQAGWNQVGVPFGHAAAWNLFQFKRDGDASAVSMSTAIANNWIDSKFYSYENNGYVANDTAQSLQPFVGYFVYAHTAGTLMLNPGAGMPDGVARIVRPVYDWRMQVVAETDQARDADNFAGEMKGASDAFGKEDSGEPPTVEPYVSAYFEHQDWGRGAGRFTEDVRGSQDAGAQGNEWTLVVETGEPGKEVKLTLPDATRLPANYIVSIRDDAAGVEFNPRERQEYSITTGPDGKRSLKITARRTDAGSMAEARLKTVFEPGWTLFSVPLETTQTDVREQLGGKMNGLQVYQYYDRRIFDQDSSDRVDIQAGIGYWLHTSARVEAEFHGTELLPGQTVDVPLVTGWNIIGNPFKEEIVFGDNITVSDGSVTVPLSGAVAEGWIQSVLYAYDPETGEYVTLEQGSTLAAWKGFMLKALKPCTVYIGK